MKDPNKKNNQNNQNKKSKKSPFSFLRPTYDLTDVLAEILAEEADYRLITARLAGCSMVAMERNDYTVDGSGDDLGDNCDNRNFD